MTEMSEGLPGMFGPGHEVVDVKVIDPNDPKSKAMLEYIGYPPDTKWKPGARITLYTVIEHDEVPDDERLRAAASVCAKILAEAAKQGKAK